MYAADFSPNCASALVPCPSAAPAYHVPGWQKPRGASSPVTGPVVLMDLLWGDALPWSPKGRWSANPGCDLSPPPCRGAGWQVPAKEDVRWMVAQHAPTLSSFSPLSIQRRELLHGTVEYWGAQSKILFRFGGREVLLISRAYWVWGFSRCWKN